MVPAADYDSDCDTGGGDCRLIHMIFMLILTEGGMGPYLVMETPTAVGILILGTVSVAVLFLGIQAFFPPDCIKKGVMAG